MAGARFRTTSRLPKIAPCDFVEPAMLISSAFRSFLSCLCAKSGAPGRTRTCDPRLRRPMLYPAELRAQSASHIVLPFGSPHVHPCTANQPDHPRSVVRAARRHVKCPRENTALTPGLEGRCSIQLSYGRSPHLTSPCLSTGLMYIHVPPTSPTVHGRSFARRDGTLSALAKTSALTPGLEGRCSIQLSYGRSAEFQTVPKSARPRNGRGERIRTSDPLLPKQMRYQTALRPARSRPSLGSRIIRARSRSVNLRTHTSSEY